MRKIKILITGKGSYIGGNLIKWLQQWPEEFELTEISLRDKTWRSHDFSFYDVVFHVAGIAHVSADPKLEELYYSVNRDLAIEVARKAKTESVKQFIFMSSIIIYGEDGGIDHTKKINQTTVFAPTDFYGRSKLEADLEIQKLDEEDFKTVIIRTPMVYGFGCKGNFPRLISLAKRVPMLPNVFNERSMIYIENLCEFIRLSIKNQVRGVFFPQNKEYVSTVDIFKSLSDVFGKRIYFTKIFNILLKILALRVRTLNKMYGNKVYDKSMSNHFDLNYCVVEFSESIRKSVKI